MTSSLKRVPATWELGKDAIWDRLPEDDETTMPPPPHRLVVALDLAKTPGEIEIILAKWEKRIAHMSNSYFGDYLSCYNANFLFSDILRAKKISHKVVCGRSGDGFEGHIWIL